MRPLIALLAAVSLGDATANEEPDYEVIAEFATFELRRYEPYIVAETNVAGGFENVGNQAFDVLFGYISGGNRGDVEIAMTAPVTQEAGDAPDEYRLAFVMPDLYTLESLPQPDDDRVQLKPVPARYVAAHRYSGSWSEERYQQHLQGLQAALEAQGLEPVAPPVFARYNAPFTPWFLRRNEILLEVAEPGSS